MPGPHLAPHAKFNRSNLSLFPDTSSLFRVPMELSFDADTAERFARGVWGLLSFIALILYPRWQGDHSSARERQFRLSLFRRAIALSIGRYRLCGFFQD